MNLTATSRPYRAACISGLFVLVVTVQAFAATNPPGFPSPLSGPGVPAVKKSQQKKIERGWQDLIAGDLAKSRKRLSKVGDVPPARLLEIQIRVVEQEPDVTSDLAAFCDRHQGYAAAWMTLSVAAEKNGDELTAIQAAQRGAQLWKIPPWGNRAADLQAKWVDDRLVRARDLFDAENYNSALAELEAVSALESGRQDVALLSAEILYSTGQIDSAGELLAGIQADPGARALVGRMAEDRGDWQAAMESYASLPEGYPGRSDALKKVQTRWRLSLLPEYARASIAANQLTRGDLAVVLVSAQPDLETLPGGTVPVMSDIVDYPGQREIITVVRLGIMDADRRGHLFYPNRPATISTVHKAAEKTRALIGRPALVWCGDPDVIASNCVSIPSPPSGRDVINAVLAPVPGAGP